LEDLDMGRIATYFRQLSRTFDDPLMSVDHQSIRQSIRLLLSTHRFARAGVNRLPQLRRKLRSLASKVAPKMAATSR
jgi:hypothetical protein